MMLAAALVFVLLSEPTPVEVAEKLASTLEGLKSVSFTYKRDLHYKSEGYQNTLMASMFVAFDSKALPTRAKFRAVMPDATCAFDGVTYWIRSRNGAVREENPPKSLGSVFVVKNSIFNLAPFLRSVVKTQPEALSLERETLAIATPGSEFDGAKVRDKVGYDPVYRIQIDPTLGLPTQITQQLKLPTDTITTTFSKWNLKPTEPKESEWRPN